MCVNDHQLYMNSLQRKFILGVDIKAQWCVVHVDNAVHVVDL